MNHTPTPWEWHAQGEANEYCMLTHDKKWVIAFRQNGELHTEEQKENARRICACVNACAGVSTDALEVFPLTVSATLSLGALQQQRDALLAFLSQINTDKDGDGFICREAMADLNKLMNLGK